MSKFVVRGGNRLSGEIRVGGSKNAVLPIIAGAVLHRGESIIHNCPRIQDVFRTMKILHAIGCKAQLEGNTLTIDASGVDHYETPADVVSKMRSSVLFMGCMLGRLGKVLMHDSGGCAIGDRPIGLHIKALQNMGAAFTTVNGATYAEVDKLKGAYIHLDRVSVGATENIMLAAATAEGETVIENAACEPEILDLQLFLNSLGADIHGAGTGTIVINGVKKLHDTTHHVMPDRIVAGTYLVAAAATYGEVRLTHVCSQDIHPITAKLMEMGCEVKEDIHSVHLKAPPNSKKLKHLPHIITEPHPGFPTDIQSQFTAILSIAEGTSIISETIFESRNKHIAELKKMEADIHITPEGRNFVVIGKPALYGTSVTANDLRGGAALIIAGLAAQGETIVSNGHFIERGYESIDRDLQSIGGDIEIKK